MDQVNGGQGTGGVGGKEAALDADFDAFARSMLRARGVGEATIDRELAALRNPGNVSRIAFDLGRSWELRETCKRMVRVQRAAGVM